MGIMAGLSIDERVTIQLAVQRYVRAMERFEFATKEFNESCCSIREVAPRPIRVIARIDHQNYLFTMDSESNFELEIIESL